MVIADTTKLVTIVTLVLTVSLPIVTTTSVLHHGMANVKVTQTVQGPTKNVTIVSAARTTILENVYQDDKVLLESGEATHKGRFVFFLGTISTCTD